MTGLSQWKPPSWCPDPQRPRWPCCTTCSTCVMGRFESMQVVGPSMNKQPSWNDALAMEKRTHPSDQGGHFVEFHTYTEEEIEDHRRLGLRPLWRDLKGHFFAWEPAPASGGAGTCWVKEVQTWTLPTLLGVYGHQFSLKQLWYAWENLPFAVQRRGRGQRGGGAAGARERVLERRSSRKPMTFWK